MIIDQLVILFIAASVGFFALGPIGAVAAVLLCMWVIDF